MLATLVRTPVVILRKHFKAIALALFLLFVPKFRLGLGRKDADRVSLFTHIVRLIFFHRVDLKLPPRTNPLVLLYFIIKRGPWGRHLIESDLVRYQQSTANHFYLPFNRHDLTKPAFMLAFFSDPDDVQQILTDKETWKTRGHTGFDDLVGEGVF